MTTNQQLQLASQEVSSGLDALRTAHSRLKHTNHEMAPVLRAAIHDIEMLLETENGGESIE